MGKWFLLWAVIFLSHSLTHSSSSSPLPSPLCHSLERSALLQFRDSFSINFSNKTVSWKNGTNCCSWNGVLCDTISGHVIGINLGSCNLEGPLRSNNTLFSLRHLETLILDFNDFHGSPIPPEFGSFSNLKRLSLVEANFSGYVPIQMSHLSKMTYLSIVPFHQNDITLETYVLKRMLQNFTNLRELSLSSINMSNVDIVSSFMNVSSSLMLLYLKSCGLQGEFPEKIFHLPNLQILSLRYNYDLIGSTPTFNWSSPLRYLDLSKSKISIDLPYLCTSAKSLQSLSLGNCSFVGSSHPIMLTNLTNLVQLTSLDLSENNFGGQIPLHHLNLNHVINLDLSRNNFIGKIPEFSKTNSTQSPPPKHLEYLYLSNNMLSGPIPSWIYSIPTLRHLALSNNNLTGTIKEFPAKSLETLSLGFNKLKGEVPNSIFQQDKLGRIDLSYNDLDGVVDFNKFSMLKNLWSLDLSFNKLIVHSNNFPKDNPFPQLRVLNLASCNITEFPYFLKGLKNLQSLQLSHNQIHGKIPEWLWNKGRSSLSDLNISHNFLTHVEKIPLENLNYLDLRSNVIQGHLPSVIPSSLKIIFISNNNLIGKIPSTYCNLHDLIILDFSNNSIHGKIPSCLGNKFSLSVLNLHKNNFSGEISDDMFENSTELKTLYLHGNNLEGPLPRSLRYCINLEVLDVSNNKINDTFPQWLEELPMLQVLVLKSNRLHGLIGAPKVKYPFRELKIMDLSHNEFNGHLPMKYFESFTSMMGEHGMSNFTHIGDIYCQASIIVVMKGSERVLEKIISTFMTIDFSRNNFEGEIPESIGQLKLLKGLNFSQNKLKGSIPMSLINLSNLEGLDLSSNELVGKIPSEMRDLTQLSFLNLSFNKLVGPIPRGNQFETFTKDSYIGNLELCGFPVTISCNNAKALPKNDFSQDTFDWKIVLMGYGCGLIIGISAGYIMLYNGRFDDWLNKKLTMKRRPTRCIFIKSKLQYQIN